MAEFITLFMRGGFMMIAIALTSVVALAIFLERFRALNRSRVIPSDVVERTRAFVKEGEIDKAKGLLDGHPSPLAVLFRLVFTHKDSPFPVIKENLDEEGRRQLSRLERYTGGLGTIASIAPLLGILGTVIGMIAAFQGVTISGYATPADLAAGVWQALLTTAFGLSVGILALIGHRVLLSQVDALALDLEQESTELIALLARAEHRDL